jgi:hypothetical protein
MALREFLATPSQSGECAEDEHESAFRALPGPVDVFVFP